MGLLLPIDADLDLLVDARILSIETWFYDSETLGTDIESREKWAMEVFSPIAVIDDDQEAAKVEVVAVGFRNESRAIGMAIWKIVCIVGLAVSALSVLMFNACQWRRLRAVDFEASTVLSEFIASEVIRYVDRRIRQFEGGVDLPGEGRTRRDGTAPCAIKGAVGVIREGGGVPCSVGCRERRVRYGGLQQKSWSTLVAPLVWRIGGHPKDHLKVVAQATRLADSGAPSTPKPLNVPYWPGLGTTRTYGVELRML